MYKIDINHFDFYFPNQLLRAYHYQIVKPTHKSKAHWRKFVKQNKIEPLRWFTFFYTAVRPE